MTLDPLVRLISFTGSTAVGRHVGQLAASQLKRCHLELGGNSAMIVMDDADVAKAASAGAWGSFLHQGQICMTTGRHIVHEAVYDANSTDAVPPSARRSRAGTAESGAGRRPSGPPPSLAVPASNLGPAADSSGGGRWQAGP